MQDVKENNSKIRVGVLRGGIGEDYEHSIRRGGEMVAHIREKMADKYAPVDIFVDQSGVWHVNGLPVVPAQLTNKVDVVWNTTHPSWSQILESVSVPSVGATPFSHTIAEHRSMLRDHVKNIGVKMPRHLVVSAYQEDIDGSLEDYAMRKAQKIFQKFGSPWIVRSFTRDANTGIHIAKTYPQLLEAIMDVAQSGKSILVEEMISGKVGTVHTIPGFRGSDMYTAFSGSFDQREKEKLMTLAEDLHRYLGAEHYLKSSFTLHPRGAIYLINVDLTPNFKEHSDLHQSLGHVGAKVEHLFEHIINKALSR